MRNLTFKLACVAIAFFMTQKIAYADATDKAFLWMAGAGVVGIASVGFVGKLKSGVNSGYCRVSGENDALICDGVSLDKSVIVQSFYEYDGERPPGSSVIQLAKSTKQLSDNMTRAGRPVKKGCARHHIVPQSDSRFYSAINSRDVLNRCHIDINDADNGADLPHSKNPQCSGSNHRKLHTDFYYSFVEALLLNQEKDYGCEGVRDGLKEIRRMLEENKLDGLNYYE